MGVVEIIIQIGYKPKFNSWKLWRSCHCVRKIPKKEKRPIITQFLCIVVRTLACACLSACHKCAAFEIYRLRMVGKTKLIGCLYCSKIGIRWSWSLMPTKDWHLSGIPLGGTHPLLTVVTGFLSQWRTCQTRPILFYLFQAKLGINLPTAFAAVYQDFLTTWLKSPMQLPPNSLTHECSNINVTPLHRFNVKICALKHLFW